MCAGVIVNNLKQWKAIKKRITIQDTNLIYLIKECREELKIGKDIQVYLSERIQSPALCGIYKPCIVLPKNIQSRISNEEIKYILHHELVHYKRKDIPINLLCCILHTIHWFNPFVWYGIYCMRKDQEIACDASVLRIIKPNEYTIYGGTLIKLLERINPFVCASNIAGIMSSKNDIKKRIKMITRFQKESYPKKIIGFALFLLSVL